MKKIILLSLLPLYVYFNLKAQDLLWDKGLYGNGDELPIRAAVDNNNNIYILATFSDSINISGIGKKTRGGTDIFLVKYNKNGVFQWLRQIGSSSGDKSNGIGVNSSNEIYIAGYFGGSRCYIDSTSNHIVYLDNYVGAGGSTDIFIVKYDANGNLIWKKRSVYGTGNQTSQAMRLDKQGNIILSGTFSTSTLYFGTNDTLVNNRVNPIIFLAKFNSSGNRIWKKRIDCAATSIFYNLDCYNNGYYFAGYYQTKIYPTNGVGSVTTRGANTDMILYKTDTAGTCKWVRVMRGGGTDQLWSVGADANGNAFIAGHFNTTSSQVKLAIDSFGTPTMDTSKITYSTTGNNDIFIAKYDEFGTLQWSEHQGSTGNDQMRRILATSNDFMFIGSMGGTITVDGTPITWKGGSGADALAIVRDNERNLIYTIQAGGTGDDIGETGLIDNEGNFYFIGDFKSATCQIGSSSLTNTSSGTSDVFIGKFDKMSLDLIPTNPKCNTSSDGSVILNVKGLGKSPFTFAWTKQGGGYSSSSQNISGLSSGKYYVTVTDAVSHSVNDSVTLTQPTAITLGGVITNTKCFNDLTGKINITAAQGTPPYSYTWTTINGHGLIVSQEDQNAVSAGKYYVIVKDNNNCPKSDSFVVTQPTALQVAMSSTNVSAPGANDGTATATPSGATSPFTYLWSPGSGTTQTITGLSGSDYVVVVTDANSCTKDTNVIVAEDSLLVVGYTYTNTKCNGSSDGTLNIIPSGGELPYSFSIVLQGGGYSNTLQNVSDLPFGTYDVTVTDSRVSPSHRTKTITVVISQPAILSSTISPSDAHCYGDSTGEIDLTVSGGTTPYSYSWSRTSGGFSATTEDLVGIVKGTYLVSINDAHACTAGNSATVNEPGAISLTSNITNQTCYLGQNDGAITVNVSGGVGPFTYLWNNGKTTATITGLSPASYSVNVTDNNGCFNTLNASVSAGLQINGFITPTSPQCNGGSDGQASFTLTAPGNGLPGSPYKWNDPLAQTTITATALHAGNYQLTVTDVKNCKGYFQTTITPPTALSLGAPSVTNVSPCYGDNNGSITITGSGGTPPYTYVFKNGGSIITSNSSGIFTNLAPSADYTIELFDSHGCDSASTLPITITQPSQLVVDLSVSDDTVCSGTSVTFTATPAGLTNYDFQIGGISVQTGISNTFVTAALVTGNIVTVTVDSSGCSKTSTGILMTVTALPTASLNGTTSICSGDSATLNITLTGTAPWSIVYSDGSTTDTINSIPSTPYTFKVGPILNTTYSITEVNDINCSGTDFGTSADVTINLPPAISVQPSNSAICELLNTGFVIGVAGNGLTYQWQLSTDGGSIWADQSNGGVYSGMTTDSMIITGATVSMDGSEYRCVVSGTCAPADTSSSAVLTVNSNPTAAASLVQQATCSGVADGIARVVASGGTAPYTYTWNTIPAQTNDTAFNLASGDYIASVTDANGCGPATSNVTVTELSSIGLSEVLASHVDVTCNGGHNGSLEVSATGGSGIYEYEISGSAIWVSDSIYINLTAGKYKVIVRDSNATVCVYSGLDSITLTEPLPVSLSQPTTINASNAHTADGNISATGSGGNGQLTYILFPAGTTNTTGSFTVSSGKYIIAVTDAFNCDTVRSDSTYVGFYTGIGPNQTLHNLRVSPNPTDGKLRIEFDDPKSTSMVVEVYNIKGEKVFMKEFKVRLAGNYKEVIDLSTYPKGMYFIRINNLTFKDAIILK